MKLKLKSLSIYLLCALADVCDCAVQRIINSNKQ
jgi:hypothetical protein